MQPIEEPALIRAFDVAQKLGYATATVKKWARQGILPGAVFVNRHIRFDARKIADFIAAGGRRELEAQPRFQIVRHVSREHSGNRPRNDPDRTRRPSDNKLAALVIADPGVRPAPGQHLLR